MAFNFGAPAAPDPPSGGGTNGGGSAPAASGSSGFSFGGNVAAPTTTFNAVPPPAATTTGGFAFGAAPSATPAAPTQDAPAFGFNFGGGKGSAPVGTAAPTPAAPSAFNFGGATSLSSSSTLPSNTATVAPDGPGRGSFSFANTPGVTVPEFETVFPNITILRKLQELLPKASLESDEGRLAAQELSHFLQTNSSRLAKPQVAFNNTVHPDEPLREKLKHNPHVMLHGQTTGLTPTMMQEIFSLTRDLNISELNAMALYAQASIPATRIMLQDLLQTSLVDSVLEDSVEPLVLGNDVVRASKELFFYERSCLLKAILLLMQYRLKLNSEILKASDPLFSAGLEPNLVSLIREWSIIAENLDRGLNNSTTTTQNTFGGPTSAATAKETRFAKVLLEFAYGERQVASECLFYLTYHTQCTGEEVAALIDVIKVLTNGTSESAGLPLLDPVHDVPSAFHEQSMPLNAWGNNPFTAALPPLLEKDPLEWEKELTDQLWKRGGKPQLLQCVSTLVLAVMCAQDSRHELVDRNTHAINSFGTGNALFPPQSTETQQLLPIHARLDPRSGADRDWRRKDIWGLLVASYALLLRTLPSVANSPRLGGSSPRQSHQGPVDVKATWRASMVTPTEQKSFTYARLCLMPSFQRHEDGPDAICDTFEFLMFVLSDFMSHYLDVLCASGDVPISRAQWEQNEERELQLRREQREQQRRFRAWSGTTENEEEIPASVDLMARPDCFDDVMAMAIALCSVGGEYATIFWSTTEEEVEETLRTVLVPSRSLRKLELQQESDYSLLPTFVSFLAVLALAPAVEDGTASGAELVNKLLSKTLAESRKSPVTWLALMEAIRWYARELSPSNYSVAAQSPAESKTSTAGLAGRPSTAYYYGVEGGGYEGSDWYASSQRSTASTSAATASKAKELGETNTNILLSNLSLITTVASKSATARSTLVSMKLPIVGQDSSSVAGEDPVLTVLFLLAIAPLSPVVRGALFATIASLVDVSDSSSEELDIIKDHARKAWELLETCRVLPISLLEQFESLPAGAAELSQGLNFPPSSLSLVGKDTKGALLPPEQKYGIVFELEHIESRRGHYPSTEGFLKLLTNLFVAAGSPADLGMGLRPRPGCSPYIEYASNFVLARALGANKDSSALPFRSLTDKYRLVSRGLEVVEAVLVRYRVPPPVPPSSVPPLTDEKKNDCLAISEASEMFGLACLIQQVVVDPDERDVPGFADDYRDLYVTRQVGDTVPDSSNVFPTSASTFSNQQSELTQVAGEIPSIPRAKSPGFTVLADILSSSTGTLFTSLVNVLVDDKAEKGIRKFCGKIGFMKLVSFALFGQTPPSVMSAKSRAHDSSHFLSPKSFLKPLLPPLEAFSRNKDDTVFWRELSVILALRIMCATVAREEAFSRAISARQTLLKVVPVLRFQPKSSPPSGIVVRDVQVSRLVNLLVSFGVSHIRSTRMRIDPLPVIVQYLKCDASSVEHDAEISGPAVALTYHTARSLGTTEGIRALCDSGMSGLARLASAMGRRLSRSSRRANSRADAEIASLILDSILSTFRERCSYEISLSHVILGLPMQSQDGELINGTYENTYNTSTSVQVTRDSFDAVLGLLSDAKFVEETSFLSLAARCFEIMYRLTEVRDDTSAADRRASYAAERLRAAHFWTVNLMRFLANHSDGEDSVLHALGSIAPEYRPKGIENTLHCIAWLLKSASIELVSTNHSATHSGQRRQLLSLFFSSPYRLFVNLLSSMPISNDAVANTGLAVAPSRELIVSTGVAMAGAAEVVGGYKIIDQAILREKVRSLDNRDSIVWWAEKWNASASWDCASTHLASAVLDLLESAIASSISAAGMLGTSHGAFELHKPTDILGLILSRLLQEGNESDELYRMNARLSQRVSYELSRAVLVLTERLALNISPNSSTLVSMEGNTAEVCLLLIHAILSSSSIDHGRPLLPQEKLRTSILGLALSTLMTSDSIKKSIGMMDQFEEAAVSIAGVALPGDSQGGDEGQSGAAIAQIALASILDVYVENKDIAVVSLLTAPSGSRARTVIQAIMSRIEALDPRICSVAERIAGCQQGPELLLDAHLLHALQKAATDYSLEEQTFRSDLRYCSASLDPPGFLRGHILLLRTLLLSPMVPTNRRPQLAADAVGVLLDHSIIIQRLFLSFPHEGLSLLACLQCLSLAGEGGGLGHFVSDQRSRSLDTAILLLAYQLSQNPFPRRYLPSLPIKLSNFIRSVHAPGNISVSSSNKDESDWWDVVERDARREDGSQSEVMPSPPSGRARDFRFRFDALPVGGDEAGRWNQELFEAAIVGARVLDTCLSHLGSRATLSPSLFFDGDALARGFCRCVDATKGTHFRLESLSGPPATMGASFTDLTSSVRKQELEKHYLSKVGGLMGRCSEKLLEMLLLHLRMLVQARDDGRDYEQNVPLESVLKGFCESLSTALDYTKIEVLGLKIPGQGGDGSSDSNIAPELAKCIRTELQKVRA